MNTQPPAYTSIPTEPQRDADGFPVLPDDFKYSTNVSACELSIRQQFLRKVYSLLTAQVIVTFAIGFAFNASDSMRKFALSNMWLFYTSMIGTFGFMGLAYWKSKSYPINLIFLLGFTLCESYIVGMVTTMYSTAVVLQAVFLTAVIFIGLTVFAMQSKYDFTSWQGALNMSLFLLIGISFVYMFFAPSDTFELVYSSIAAFIFGVYVLVDTQLICRKVYPDEEIVASIMLYLDLINLFINILRILGRNDD